MSLNISITNDCSLLTIRAKSYIGGSTGTITITEYETGVVFTDTIVFSGNNGLGVLNLDVSLLASPNGVYRVCLVENAIEQICKPVFIHCNLDCCLTKLTNELLACDCDCPKCSTVLAKAQKIFLLLQSSLSTVNIASADPDNEGYYIDMLIKYKKAIELCDGSCGCNC